MASLGGKKNNSPRTSGDPGPAALPRGRTLRGRTAAPSSMGVCSPVPHDDPCQALPLLPHVTEGGNDFSVPRP